jgi:hypothetical protein
MLLYLFNASVFASPSNIIGQGSVAAKAYSIVVMPRHIVHG